MKHYERLRAASRHAAMFVSLLAITAPAFGAEVSGMVTLDGRPFVGKLKLSDGTQVDIIDGQYRIFVAAGDYPVTFEHQNGRTFRATIHSSTVPVNRDINLPNQ
jgi:hypothetical protein